MTDVKDIFRIEDFVKVNMDPQACEWIHRFAPGMYSREMYVPAGTLMTGAIHRQEHFSVFLEGVILVPDDEGGSQIIEAPHIEIAQPGTKRVGVALTDVRWVTFHATDKKTVHEAEEDLFTNDPKELDALLEYIPQGEVLYEETFASEQRDPQIEADRQDYLLTQEPPELLEQLREIPVKDMEIPGVAIRPSERDGFGIFATHSFQEGEVIAPGVIGGELICFSRYCNHGAKPNAKPLREGQDLYIQASRDIDPGEEILMDYRVTLKGDY